MIREDRFQKCRIVYLIGQDACGATIDEIWELTLQGWGLGFPERRLSTILSGVQSLHDRFKHEPEDRSSRPRMFVYRPEADL